MVTAWGAVRDDLSEPTKSAKSLRFAELGIGEVWYVDSGGTAGGGRSPDAPLATLDEAINLAAAGDTIVVMPGHAETLADATSLVPDVDRLTIIGLGRGQQRPTFTLTATASNIPVSGDGVRIENIRVVTSGTVDVTAGITVTGADCELDGIEVVHSANDSEIVDSIVITTGGDRARLTNIKIFGAAAGDAAAAGISIPAAIPQVWIENVWIVGLFSAGCIENVTAAATDLVIKDAVLEQRHATQDAGIAVVGTATGFIIAPRIRTATDDAAGFNAAITATNDMQVYDPLVVNADGERGGLWGTASAAA